MRCKIFFFEVVSVWAIQDKNVSSTPRDRDGQQRLLLTR
jgi:hypothetical protein